MQPKKYVFFNDIPIAYKFQPPTKITYQKISSKQCIPLLTANGQTITDKKVSEAFTNSTIQLIIVS